MMIGLAVAAITHVRAYIVSRHRSAWRLPLSANNSSCASGNDRALYCASSIDCFGLRCGNGGPGGASALIIVRAETVVSWHRAGFRRFWRLRSRPPGRPKISDEIRGLIRRMKTDNPGWGAPRIHGELLQLGFDISEPTVSRYLQRLKHRTDRKKVKRWLAFLQNHREIIAAFDFFTVPTRTFGVLYCFFVIEHHRRRILHFNVTAHPTSNWIVQQLREAFPLPCPQKERIIRHHVRRLGKLGVAMYRPQPAPSHPQKGAASIDASA